MTTYSRLSTVLGETRHYPLGEDCSFRRKVVGLGLIGRIESLFPRCPGCNKWMTRQVVGIETNDFAHVSWVTQYYGPCCVECGIVLDNNGDMN